LDDPKEGNVKEEKIMEKIYDVIHYRHKNGKRTKLTTKVYAYNEQSACEIAKLYMPSDMVIEIIKVQEVSR
jgi:hypothetical protein